MDPLSALGCASAIVQFVDFGTKLLGSTYEVFQSVDGATNAHLHLSGLCRQLQYLGEKIQSRGSRAWRKGYTEDQAHLLDLVSKCRLLAKEILDTLDGLQVDKSKRFQSWHALRAATASALSAKRLTELQARLDDLRNQLSLHMVFMMSNAQSAVASSITILASRCEAMHLENLDMMSRYRDSLHNVVLQQGQDFHLMLDELKQLKAQEFQQLKAQKPRRDNVLNIPSDLSNIPFGIIGDARRVATPDATKAFDQSLAAVAKHISDMLSGADATSAALSSHRIAKRYLTSVSY